MGTIWRYAYLLLLHEFRVGAVVDDVLAKDRGGQRGVDFLGVDVLDLAIENEVVPLGVQTHGHLAAEKDESEDIAVLRLVSLCPVSQVHATHLLLVGEEELVWVDAVCYGTADDWEQMEHDRGLVGVLEQQLVQDVEDDGEHNKGGEAGRDQDR
jgi:hypothetical protein